MKLRVLSKISEPLISLFRMQVHVVNRWKPFKYQHIEEKASSQNIIKGQILPKNMENTTNRDVFTVPTFFS